MDDRFELNIDHPWTRPKTPLDLPRESERVPILLTCMIPNSHLDTLQTLKRGSSAARHRPR